jgi:hypothetical protein
MASDPLCGWWRPRYPSRAGPAAAWATPDDQAMAIYKIKLPYFRQKKSRMPTLIVNIQLLL